MRVLFLHRSDSDRLIGGTAEQLRQYARAVTERGGEAVLSAGATPPSGRFDVAHVFNVDWPLETARQMQLALRCADRVVLSPVHHERRWEEAYHRAGRDGLSRRVASVVGPDAFTALRGAVQAAPVRPLWREAARQLAGGVAARQRWLLGAADAWLVASPQEADAVVADFGVPRRPTTVVRNGGDWTDDLAGLMPLPDDFVLCVARVEARKNQLALARALVSAGLTGVFVGPPNPRHRTYVRRFAAYVGAAPSLTWMPSLDRRRTLAMFGRARVHALASWYEVAALVDSEAAVAGAQVITTARSYSRDVLGSAAVYWDPESGHAALTEALRLALARSASPGETRAFRRDLAWERIREDVARVYGLADGPAAPIAHAAASTPQVH